MAKSLRCWGWIGLLLCLVLSGCQPQPPAVGLLEAVERSNLKAIQQHIAAKSDLNITDHNGWTPLQRAAMKGDLPVVQALVAGGADVDRPGQGGKTALDLARSFQRTPVVQFLEAQAAAPSRSGGGGRGLVDGGLGVSGVLDNQ